ncbi:hypothetical protein X758_19530 [Mesorhizobium sp. LSHC416B00]|nr:hypothetical protein X758_19530 [Mesorhizobium sp. LSHC416B00]
MSCRTAATAIILPLLPNRTIDPWGGFNPWEVWLLTVLMASAAHRWQYCRTDQVLVAAGCSNLDRLDGRLSDHAAAAELLTGRDTRRASSIRFGAQGTSDKA